jgi:RNA polymerase sigma factor (sigma-70 family)
MLHHTRAYIRTREADRRAPALRRRPPADQGELERVVRAAAAGDSNAFSNLVERFGRRVRAIARVHRLTAHDVEDVMQTTWLRLFQHVGSIRDPDAVGAWLETTARRESLRIIRSSTRERLTDDALLLDSPVPSVEEQHLAAQARAALPAAMEQLPDRQRELLAMLLRDPSPSYAEISRTLGIPIGSIGPTRGRCIARLREAPVFKKGASDG